MTPANLHASALVIGDRGLIVTGPSGSGKTQLCLALLDRCARHGVFARLVADDQVFLKRAGGRLVAKAPDSIAGLVEVRGYRPSPIASVRLAIVDRMVRLVPSDDAPRFGEGETERLEGCPIPCLCLPARDTSHCVSAVCAWLALEPFGAKWPQNSARSCKNDFDAGKLGLVNAKPTDKIAPLLQGANLGRSG